MSAPKRDPHIVRVMYRSIIVLIALALAVGVGCWLYMGQVAKELDGCSVDARMCEVDYGFVWTGVFFGLVTAAALVLLAMLITASLAQYIFAPSPCISRSCPCVDHRRRATRDKGSLIAIAASVAAAMAIFSSN